MTVEKTVEALCEQHRKDGGDPQAATVLSLVTWEEIYTAVCNMLNDMGLLLPDITIRDADDWIAVYKNGEKVEENDGLDPHFVLEALGIPFEHRSFDPDEMNEWGSELKDGSDPFPEKLP